MGHNLSWVTPYYGSPVKNTAGLREHSRPKAYHATIPQDRMRLHIASVPIRPLCTLTLTDSLEGVTINRAEQLFNNFVHINMGAPAPKS